MGKKEKKNAEAGLFRSLRLRHCPVFPLGGDAAPDVPFCLVDLKDVLYLKVQAAVELLRAQWVLALHDASPRI